MKKKLSFSLVLFGIISILVLNVPIIHFPINTPKYLANIDSKPSYIPFKDTKRYSTIISCGRNCLEVDYHYKNGNSHLSILITDKTSASSDSIWGESKKIKNSKFFYEERKNKQLIAWREVGTEQEFFIKLESKTKIDKKELIKVAESLSNK
jgi:hypothetical protein